MRPAVIAIRVRSLRLMVVTLWVARMPEVLWLPHDSPVARTQDGREVHRTPALLIMASAIDQTFSPAQADWQHVSPRLTAARRVTWSILFVVLLIVLLSSSSFQTFLGSSRAAAVVLVIAYGWGLWYFGRRTKSWAYAERADDLIVIRGFMFKRLVIVPYGRMQLVDLAAGPIDRAFGIAKLQLHTAAATSDACIPGLVPEVAAALRDRLASLGEQRAAGL